MERSKRKLGMAFLILAFLIILITAYAFSLKTQLREARAAQTTDTKRIQSLENVQDSEASKVNREFMEKFFEYKSTKERYAAIRSLMTDRGYSATYPSGFEPPDDSPIESSMSALKPYEYQDAKNQIEYMNQLKVSTKFNKVSNTESMVLRTRLIYVQDTGWKVDDVEFISQL